MNSPYRIIPAGDAALLIAIGDPSNRHANLEAVAVANALRNAAVEGVRDIVPTTRSVGVFFDPMRTNHRLLTPMVSELVEGAGKAMTADGVTRDVPVCYGGAYGPDLRDVAERAGVDEHTVVSRHTARTYEVQMLGFAPGFAYLGELDARIALPRRSLPRPRVAAGSVGIAETQTGIYPFDMPGGWHIIGQTSCRPCDFSRSAPFLLAPGDRVRFHAVDVAEFTRLTSGATR